MKTSLILTISIVLLYPLLLSSDYATISGNDFSVFQITGNTFVEEAERELILEDWMTNDDFWELKSELKLDETDQDEGEDGLVIESWMTDDNLWM